jgi:putative pyruvate formate lyase activating enzyme
LVHSFGKHFGYEAPLRGWHGSGAIIFSGCNLRCIYCKHKEISQKPLGWEVEPGELANMMLALQEKGCHNINLVRASHVVAQLVAAVSIAAQRGLALPLVYSSGGYDSPEALALLDGVVDVYAVDMKYAVQPLANQYSDAPNYVEVNRAAAQDMYRQVGGWIEDDQGLVRRGVLVRHLVLPGNLENTEQVLAFLARNLAPDIRVHLVGRYQPAYGSFDFPELTRSLSEKEYGAALAVAEKLGLKRIGTSEP